jgi:thioredoxin 1
MMLLIPRVLYPEDESSNIAMLLAKNERINGTLLTLSCRFLLVYGSSLRRIVGSCPNNQICWYNIPFVKGIDMAVSITKENFTQEIERATLPVVMDVFASWCGPCQQMTPIFEALEKELKNEYKFTKLNVDEARDLSIQFGITSVPTFLFFKNGKIVAKETGYMSKEDLKSKTQSHLS